MSVDTSARNVAAGAVAAVGLRLALHTGDPGAAAANEVSGGGYARQPVSWDAASGGISLISADVSFDVPAVTISWVSLWNAAGSVRYGKALLASPAVFPTAGVLTLTDADLDWS